MPINPNKSPAYIIGFAAVVSLVFTAAIMALHIATEPIVKRNERLLVEKALVDLFDLGDPDEMSAEEISELVMNRIAGYQPGDEQMPYDQRRKQITITDPETGTEIPLYVAFKDDVPEDAEIDIHDKDNIVGYAFPISGVGFWAGIDGLLAVQPDLERTLGMVILDHQETPGLGGRITEKEFRDQFRPQGRANDQGVLVTIPDDGDVVTIARQGPPPTSDEYNRHVDSITGATGTSTALADFVNQDIRIFQRAAEAAGLKKPRTGTGDGEED